MAAIETIVACVAVLAVLGVLIRFSQHEEPEPQPAAEDLAAPYREGLHAAVRMQQVARDLEQQMYAEAARHMGEGGDDGTRA